MPANRPPEPDIRRYYPHVYDEAGRLDRTPQGRLERAVIGVSCHLLAVATVGAG
ncbi:hypothetical protein ABZ754_07040 [Micromonospora purpureochromogenes]|uniref:hypothetical protein n=1 Tax=Micromonospora purpureochromogenes TaxID=47872 RepID=UPI0033E2BA4C